MKTVILGEYPEIKEVIARRQLLGQDGYDEVWEGVYHMAPMAYPWHGIVQFKVAGLLSPSAQGAGLIVSGPFNLGDDVNNFRVPDLGVHRTRPVPLYVPTCAIVVEIVSPDDETFDKFGFYRQHGVEEILTVDQHGGVAWWLPEDRPGVDYVVAERSKILGVTVAEITEGLEI